MKKEKKNERKESEEEEAFLGGGEGVVMKLGYMLGIRIEVYVNYI